MKLGREASKRFAQEPRLSAHPARRAQKQPSTSTISMKHLCSHAFAYHRVLPNSFLHEPQAPELNLSVFFLLSTSAFNVVLGASRAGLTHHGLLTSTAANNTTHLSQARSPLIVADVTRSYASPSSSSVVSSHTSSFLDYWTVVAWASALVFFRPTLVSRRSAHRPLLSLESNDILHYLSPTSQISL